MENLWSAEIELTEIEKENMRYNLSHPDKDAFYRCEAFIADARQDQTVTKGTGVMTIDIPNLNIDLSKFVLPYATVLQTVFELKKEKIELAVKYTIEMQQQTTLLKTKYSEIQEAKYSINKSNKEDKYYENSLIHKCVA